MTEPPRLDVTVVGCGYVGLVTAVGLAHAGHHVTGVETDAERREMIAAGRAPFYEPGLPELLSEVLADGRLVVADELSSVRRSSVVLLAVQTPPKPDGANDVQFLEKAAVAVAAELQGSDHRPVVAVRSTVVPGTVGQVVAPALTGTGAIPASNPEFLQEASAVADFLEPDRIVVGCDDPAGLATLRDLYAPVGGQLFELPIAGAELAKYASNALLATMISFSNEIAGMCEDLPGVDAEDVLATVHADRRLTPVVDGLPVRPGILNFLRGGCGYGGSCLPKDMAALIAYRQETVRPASLISAVHEINEGQAARLVAMTEAALGGLDGRRVALLGLAFKAGTDDLRASPALKVADLLSTAGAEVIGFDPLVAAGRAPDVVKQVASVKDALKGADAVVLCTNAPEFRTLRTSVPVIDGRRDVDASVTTGPYYAIGLGRPSGG